LENLFYRSITLQIFENDAIKDEFERKLYCSKHGIIIVRRGEETFVLKKGYFGNFVKGKGGI